MAVEVPENCTCGTLAPCPLHFVDDDFFPGAIVFTNQYAYSKYGWDLAPKSGLQHGTPYRVASVKNYNRRNGGQGLLITLEGGSRHHHGCFLPNRFLSAAAKAVREHDARKADKERYCDANP